MDMKRKKLCLISLVLGVLILQTCQIYILYTLINEPRDEEYFITKIIAGKRFVLNGTAQVIAEVNGKGELVYFTFHTDNPLTSLVFYCDREDHFDFQVKWEFKYGRTSDTSMVQILKYDVENSVYAVQILIPLRFRESFIIKAYVSDMSEAHLEIWELIIHTLTEGEI